MPASTLISPTAGSPPPVGAPAPRPISGDTVRRGVQTASLPCLAAAAASEFRPSPAQRLSMVEAAARVLDDPALLLAAYALAHKLEIRDPSPQPDPLYVVERLGLDQLVALSERACGLQAPKDSAALAAFVVGLRHALAASRLATLLAPDLKLNPRIAAASALLHDVGRLALQTTPEAAHTASLYEFARNAALATTYLEESVLGVTHKALGAQMCTRHHVPALIAAACGYHEDQPTQRAALHGDVRPLAALVAACDAVSKAHGLGGCASEELRHVPAELQPHVLRRAKEICALIAEVGQLSNTRWSPAPSPPAPARPLSGLVIAYATRADDRWSPYSTALQVAGATIVPVAWGTVAPPGAGALVLDSTDCPLLAALPGLVAVARQSPATPRLLLADRCHEPEDRVRAVEPQTACYATPIRAGNLTAAVLRLTRGASPAALPVAA